MSAVFRTDKDPRQLDAPEQPDEQVTEEQVTDKSRVVRLFMRLLRDIARLKRRWSPQFSEFEDAEISGDGTTKYRFAHGFKKRVRWWVVDWRDASGGPALVCDDSTDDTTLVLRSYEAGTMTLRIEEAG